MYQIFIFFSFLDVDLLLGGWIEVTTVASQMAA